MDSYYESQKLYIRQLLNEATIPEIRMYWKKIHEVQYEIDSWYTGPNEKEMKEIIENNIKLNEYNAKKKH